MQLLTDAKQPTWELKVAFPLSPQSAKKPHGAQQGGEQQRKRSSGVGTDEWQQVGRQKGRQDPRLVPTEVQAAKSRVEAPMPVSALWGEAEKSAEAAAMWGDEVKWWKFNQPDERLSVHAKQARGGGMGGRWSLRGKSMAGGDCQRETVSFSNSNFTRHLRVQCSSFLTLWPQK